MGQGSCLGGRDSLVPYPLTPLHFVPQIPETAFAPLLLSSIHLFIIFFKFQGIYKDSDFSDEN